MEREELKKLIEDAIQKFSGSLYVPVGVSNRHIHVSREDLDILYGKGYALTKMKDLKQPGEYAANETLEVKTKKGSFGKVRILGPVRGNTQVELSLSDSYGLGLSVPIRESGSIKGSEGVTLVGPKGEVTLTEGVIAAYRHIHMPKDMAEKYGFRNGDIVSVEKEGKRGLIFQDVMLRVSPKYALEMHIDVDEANAGSIRSGDLLKIIRT
ncbi:phosphate propanoyltransferase [Proteiniclasticum sp. SCR006]|uniref:Phosphate propanoyltransferase n=1 Tax=Proteiniclasticum aestuarii TaxID=2817862 RepID=A0A939H9P0_9CLOT|nr:phosphate propanoyltransferase [Proteiniclasticum aestuarii]MBO1264041.1 phosphate propanoyltransferase [Proteiniclasticum aestuarii]